MTSAKGRVCVTGAGGYVASWLVKLLLSKGYSVHGTVRDPSEMKNAHLKNLDNAPEHLKLFKAELLDCQSIFAAIEGCDGVFHVASPIPSSPNLESEMELLEPAVKGTLNVLKASSEANVKRVVFVSSGAAIVYNPAWPKGQVKDETCWSDSDYCRNLGNVVSWYALSKTEAEREAIEYGKTSGLDVVTVCPTLVLGPMLQPTMNASSSVLLSLLKGRVQTSMVSQFAERNDEAVDNPERMIVDVRDVAAGLVLAYENPEAKGRYICTAHPTTTKDLVERLQIMYPDYNYPKNFKEVELWMTSTSEKLQKLGWSFRPLEETLADSVESCKDAGFLD